MCGRFGDHTQAHASVLPKDLDGHIVICVSYHPRLEHYIVPLRRLRPHIPVVLVSPDSTMYYELMFRLTQIKAMQPGLNLDQVYYVHGTGKQRKSLEKARADRAEATVLLSAMDSRDDSDCLMSAFALEQVRPSDCMCAFKCSA